MYLIAFGIACLTLFGSLALGVYDVVEDFRWSRSEAGKERLATVRVTDRNES